MTTFSLNLKGIRKVEIGMLKTEETSSGAGFFKDQVHPEHDIPLATIADKNNEGFTTPEGRKVPARPFFDYAVNTCDSVMADPFIRGAGKIASGDKNVRGNLKNAADTMAEWISVYIKSDELYEPNAPFTIKKKGFDKPLTETGYLSENVEGRLL